MSAQPVVPGGTQTRKVLTILFTDVAESTALGQALDPEALRHVMARWFEEMRRVVERHEGVVAKFIGDAVLAVFGVPRAHEDDALRAARAAVGMRDALAALNRELRAQWGVSIAARTGVNSGEVLVGGPPEAELLVVGDPVNTAARLEQAAAPGEILLGEETHRLVRDAVAAEPTAPLRLKGIAQPLVAWRLHEVAPERPGRARRLDAALVGRGTELAALEAAFAATQAERRCRVVTVLGAAGIGKSRLIAELTARVGDRATVLSGRCLPYGDGITFWPVASVLRQAFGIREEDSAEEAERRLAAALTEGPDAAGVIAGLAGLLGLGPAAGLQEAFWAVRRTLEDLAAPGGLVVVFDDLHWAEPTFLELLEHLADRLGRVGVLLLCQARPELLDERPGWMAGRANASAVELGPLTAAETDDLLRGLAGGAELPPEVCTRIADACEGNPLFVEETLRMLLETGAVQATGGHWTIAGDLGATAIPPTVNALLAARLDRLPAAERAVIERASVVGRSFWRDAVCELTPPAERDAVAGHLAALGTKQLIRPSAEEPGEDAFEFAHILVRDASYRGLPKAVRADMHERLAGWIEERTLRRPAEYQEIVGYHLELAHRSLLELAPAGARAAGLARRAAAALAATGRRAFARADMPAAVNLLGRAADLLGENDAGRLELLPELAFALMETGDLDGLRRVTAELARDAATAGNGRLQAHAVVLDLTCRLLTSPDGWAAAAHREATAAVSVLSAAGDDEGLMRACSLLGMLHIMESRFGDAEAAWRSAADHARRAGMRRDELEALAWLPMTVWAGPTSAEPGVRRCLELRERAHGDKKATAAALFSQAVFEAGLGRDDESRRLLAWARALLEEVALPVWIAGPLAQFAGWAELLMGDPAAAERHLRDGCATLQEIGEVSWLASVLGLLAEALVVQGRDEEAEELTRLGEASGSDDDVYAHVLCRSVRAKALARRGRHDDAVALAGDAVRLGTPTDFLHLRWQALMAQAEVLRAAGRDREAAGALSAARALAEAKGNLVGVQLAQRAAAGAAAGPPAPA